MDFSSQQHIYYDKNYLGICWKLLDNPRAFSYYDHNFNQLIFYDNPAYIFNAFDVEIKNIIFDQDQTTSFTLLETYNYQENIILNRNKAVYSDELATTLNTEIYLNSKLVFQDNYLNYFEQLNDQIEINFDYQINPYQNNFTLRIENSSIYGYQETEIFNVYSAIDQDIYLNFNNNLVENILIPLEYNDQIYSYQRLTFVKLFKNNYLYPHNIKPLLLLNYDDQLSNYPLELKAISKGVVSTNGIENGELSFDIGTKRYGENILFYVDDNFYYDLDQNITKKGIQYQTNSASGFIIPWDYSNNYGEISFDFTINIYQDLNIHVELPFYVKNSLRGEANSKYQFVLKDDSEFNEPNNYDCFLEFYLKDFYFPLSRNEIEKIIEYE